MIDSQAHERFAVYTDGNFGEVAPERLSPLAWSLVGPPMEQAFRSLAATLRLPAILTSGSRYVYVGYFHCKPYHNLGALDLWADLVPGADRATLVRSYFRDAVPTGWRPEPTVRPSVGRRLRTGRALLAAFADAAGRLPGAVEHGVAPGVPHAGPANPLAAATELIDLRRRLWELWSAHVVASTGPVILSALQARLGRRLIDGWDGLEPLVDVPAESPWEVARASGLLVGGSPLTRAIYEVSRRAPPWTASTEVGPSGAVPAPPAEVAGRGGETYDHASVLDALRGVHRGPSGTLVGIASSLLAQSRTLREATKVAIALVLDRFADLAPDAARTAGLPDDLWPLVSIHELLGVHPLPSARTLDQRLEAVSRALGRPAARVVRVDAGGVHPVPTAASTTIGVSPGRVAGVAVTPATADEDAGPHVLFCDHVDATVQALLTTVDGVVAARGSEASHVAIVARSLGIPAVVGYARASGVPPGTPVVIDGSTGEVRLDGE